MCEGRGVINTYKKEKIGNFEMEDLFDLIMFFYTFYVKKWYFKIILKNRNKTLKYNYCIKSFEIIG